VDTFPDEDVGALSVTSTNEPPEQGVWALVAWQSWNRTEPAGAKMLTPVTVAVSFQLLPRFVLSGVTTVVVRLGVTGPTEKGSQSGVEIGE
jgi:hypothetical protein